MATSVQASQPTLTTARLLLRPFTLADAPAVRELAGAKEVADGTLTIPHPYPEGAAEEWIAKQPKTFAMGLSVVFAVVLPAESTLCGAIGLELSPANRHAELGYWIGKPYWGRGLCTEAAHAMLDYGFRVLGLHRIHASHFAWNEASGRVMRKIGMRPEGCLRDHILKNGEFLDLMKYGILASDD